MNTDDVNFHDILNILFVKNVLVHNVCKTDHSKTCIKHNFCQKSKIKMLT